ncbi:leucine-rich repeat protein [Perkinsela sp. CCAP 1560/4]|nr:leucine-rich repeat protein [Perkinsela sp. CCAP 1560/4]|eukprot:KNH06238.1 leucine-rich repeat protein [Perkinsela sp. CCAP 1560/4]
MTIQKEGMFKLNKWFNQITLSKEKIISVDLTRLSAGLTILCVGRNDFTEPADFSTLPDRMEKLNLSRNDFPGSLELRKLPAALRTLKANGNTFTEKSNGLCMVFKALSPCDGFPKE